MSSRTVKPIGSTARKAGLCPDIKSKYRNRHSKASIRMFLSTAFPSAWTGEANARRSRSTTKPRHICIFTAAILTLGARIIARQFRKTAARAICIFWLQGARDCSATEGCMRPVSAVRQIATRTGITLICMGTACAFTLAQARRIQSGTEKFVRPAVKTAPASVAAGTEQGNISTLCPARSPQKAAIMAQVSAAEEEEAETISVFMEEISLRPAEVLRPVLAAVSRRAQRKYEFMAVRLPLRPEWAAPESAAAL